MHRHPRARLATVLALVLSLAGLIPAGAAASTVNVTMGNDYAFHPGLRVISRGDTVKWKNTVSLPHDVKSNLSGYFTSPGGSGGLTKDETYPKQFKQAGTFVYYCRFHQYDDMRGKIVVPITVSRSGSTFTITVSSSSGTGKWRNKVQVRKPGSSGWTTLSTTSYRSVTYSSSKTGTYKFRSAVKDSDTGATSGYSPTVSKTR